MKRIFIDQDGVLADFEKGCNDDLSRMFEKNFFLNLEPMEDDLDEIIVKLQQENYEVHVLTKLPVKRDDAMFLEMLLDKVKWLCRYVPSIDLLNIHILPCNEDKTLVLNFYPDKENCILIDDYTPNLASWMAAGGKSIKLAKRFKDTRVVAQILSIRDVMEVV